MAGKKTNKETNNNNIKKPKLVLNNATKLYLATKELEYDSAEGLFFIASLFLPITKGFVPLNPCTEVAAFDDALSAIVYRETIDNMAKLNLASTMGKEYADLAAAFVISNNENVR